jgi:hypothetical protein
MYPWTFFWAPQLHFPWSGGVAQQIDTRWFFDSIEPTAGDGRIEKKAFDIASYGRQLGLITEVLIDLADEVAPKSEQGKTSLERLRDIKSEIDKLKDDDASKLVREIEARVETLRRSHKSAYPLLRAELESAVNAGGARHPPIEHPPRKRRTR